MIDKLKHRLVVSSNQEGLPRGTIKGMSRALPCVVSNAEGLPELIGNDFFIKSMIMCN